MLTVKIHDTYLLRENLGKRRPKIGQLGLGDRQFFGLSIDCAVVICTQLTLGKLYQVLAIRQLEWLLPGGRYQHGDV